LEIISKPIEIGNLEKEFSGHVYNFPRGIIGFQDSVRYQLEANARYSPFIKLKSLDEVGVEFVMMDPWIVKEDYRFEISDPDLELLMINNTGDLLILAIVTISRKDSRISLNLMAPVAINQGNKTGCQIILDNPKLPLRYQVSLE